MSQEAPVVDYETAAKELTYERAPAWRPEAFEQHPRVIAGVVVRVNRRVTDQSAADIFTIETGLAQGGTEKQPAWSIWAFDPQQGQEPSRRRASCASSSSRSATT